MQMAPPAVLAALVVCSTALATPAAAQEAEKHAFSSSHLALPEIAVAPPEIAISRFAPSAVRRPTGLMPLYISFGALQGLDAHSTAAALRRGAVEANPLMQGVASHEVGLLALKAAGTTGLIFASEKLWKKNPAAAVALMIASNSAMIWVVQHNYRAAR